MSVAALKKDMRRDAKLARGRAFAEHGAGASETIAHHGIGFAGTPPPAIVSGFLAIGDEIDPTPLMRRLLGEGYRLCLPVMEGKGKPLVIREPLPEAPVLDPDVVLGPLLAFDTRGYRLGYGGGFYDRTLARLRALKPIASIGIAFDEQKVDAVPHVDYDERLDWILTPSGPLKCGVDAA